MIAPPTSIAVNNGRITGMSQLSSGESNSESSFGAGNWEVLPTLEVYGSSIVALPLALSKVRYVANLTA
jgi:hypothetical protein